MYSNSCCSCSFKPEIKKLGQSSHKLYSNKILNFQESMTILDVHRKKVWELIVCTSYVYWYVYIYVCIHVFIYIYVYIYVYI